MKKKVVLITGCSSGFGKLAVIQLLARGHTVIAALRGGETRLQSIFADELKKYGSEKLLALDLHMERADSFLTAKRLIEEKFHSQLDVLINNAGYGLMGPIEDASSQQIHHQFEVNFFGPVFLTKTLLPEIKRAQGRIINVSSICGLVTFPFYNLYNASKYALEAHTEALFYELKPFQVQVALVEPGSFKTEFVTGSLQFTEGSKKPESPYFKKLEAFRKWALNKQNFSGNPENVATLFVKLVEKDKIRLRYLIGLDAKVMWLMSKLLPEKLRLIVLDQVFRRNVFKS